MMVQKQYFKVTNIMCVACASFVERSVSQIKGVSIAKLDFSSGQLYTEYSSPASTAIILEVLEANGYPASISDGQISTMDNAAELRKMRLSVLVSFILSLPLVDTFWYSVNKYVQLACATAILIYSGRVFYRDAFYAVKNRVPNMSLMVTIGTFSAYVISFVGVFWGNKLGIDRLYFMSVGMVITLVSIGKYMEKAAMYNTHKDLQNLMELRPNSAILIVNGEKKETDISRINVGDILFIAPGDIIPADSIVQSGHSSINQANMTGESIPIEVNVGDRLLAATVNLYGTLTALVDKPIEENVFSQIVQTVIESLRGKKSRMQRFADHAVGNFLMIVLAVALLTFLLWFFLLDPYNIVKAIITAVSVLVAACPCALGIATPLAMEIAVSGLAQSGILVKDSSALEEITKIRAIVFDKTGTLTKGEVVIDDFIPLGCSESEFLQYLADIENSSQHPIARAVMNNPLISSLIPHIPIQICEENSRTEASFSDGTRLVVCRADVTILSSEQKNLVQTLIDSGKTVSILLKGNTVLGLIVSCDDLRDGTPKSIETLKKMGIETVMLTGDGEKVAERVAKQSGVDKWYARLLPFEKADYIKEMKEYGGVAMIGDGINDVASILEASVGISIGSVHDLNMESADIIISQNKIAHLLKILYVGNETIKNIKTSLTMCICYNGIAILLSMFGILSPVYAGLAMSLSSFAVTFNARRLAKKIAGISFEQVVVSWRKNHSYKKYIE